MSTIRRRVVAWFNREGRDLPWRGEHCSPWGILVSEVMLQQTPVSRVLPRWHHWMQMWPTAVHCAQASVADVLRAWDRLGYPRRALRLHQSATLIANTWDGHVPSSEDDLRSLPGIGEYTAAAVASFAFAHSTVVLDTNIRRVLVRVFEGEELPPQHVTNTERSRARNLLPSPRSGVKAAEWNAAVMELGALVCTARQPACERCPIADDCRWRSAGYPPSSVSRRSQPWDGTDRKTRGEILAALRNSAAPLPEAALTEHFSDAVQFRRCLASLTRDGLIVEVQPNTWALPGH